MLSADFFIILGTLIIVFALAMSIIYTLRPIILDAQKKNRDKTLGSSALLNKDEKADINMISEMIHKGMNLMNVHELAIKQKQKKHLNLLYIVAPHFLELSSEEVYQSTLNILRNQIEVKFCFFISKETETSFDNIRARYAYDLNIEVRELIPKFSKVVVAPEFFLSDYTIWNPHGPDPEGYANVKSEDRTELCIKMPNWQLFDVIKKLNNIKHSYDSNKFIALIEDRVTKTESSSINN